MVETYLPLLQVFRRLQRDRARFRLTFSISPTLLCMWRDPVMQRRCAEHLDRLIELVEKELRRTRHQPYFHDVARMYHERFVEARDLYVNQLGGDLVGAFKSLQWSGHLELITCAATHAYLPAHKVHPPAVRAQIITAVELFQSVMGHRPRGFWLPECGYYPGLEQILGELGIRYFFVETHGLLHATTRAKYGVYAPLCCPNGVAAFARDPEVARQVWCSKVGYAGDADYREFYRDIGYALEYEYIRPYILSTGQRVDTGIKYYRVTSNDGFKMPYVPQRGTDKAGLHAGHFFDSRRGQIDTLRQRMDRPPIIVAPFDAELFGHWWYEGPQWLDFVIRKFCYDQDQVRLICPSDYLRIHPVNQLGTPSASSWGDAGYSDVWINPRNDWMYPQLHRAAERLTALVHTSDLAQPLVRRLLTQAARELLLAQASDWAFMLAQNTTADYARERFDQHLQNFSLLVTRHQKPEAALALLQSLERANNVFENLNLSAFA